jgi:hypothetical protein
MTCPDETISADSSEEKQSENPSELTDDMLPSASSRLLLLPRFVAQGKFVAVNTERLLIKRILLTGYSANLFPFHCFALPCVLSVTVRLGQSAK